MMHAYRTPQSINPEDPQRIYDCLQGKCEALRQFLDATVALREALCNQDQEKIDALIQMRESCIVRINEIDSLIRDLTEKEPSYLKRLSVSDREKIGEISGTIEATLDKIATANKDCIGSASRRLRTIQDDMSLTVGHRHDLQRSYGKGQPPRFLSVSG